MVADAHTYFRNRSREKFINILGLPMFRDPTIKLLLVLAAISNIGTQQLPPKELVCHGSILSDAQGRPDCGRRMKAVFI